MKPQHFYLFFASGHLGRFPLKLADQSVSITMRWDPNQQMVLITFTNLPAIAGYFKYVTDSVNPAAVKMQKDMLKIGYVFLPTSACAFETNVKKYSQILNNSESIFEVSHPSINSVILTQTQIMSLRWECSHRLSNHKKFWKDSVPTAAFAITVKPPNGPVEEYTETTCNGVKGRISGDTEAIKKSCSRIRHDLYRTRQPQSFTKTSWRKSKYFPKGTTFKVTCSFASS